MNLKTIQKNYDLLSVRERFALFQSALCRLDGNEIVAILANSPHKSYRMPDIHFFIEAVFYLHSVNYFARLNHAEVFITLVRLNDKDDESYRMSAYLYVIETDAWSLVGEEFGVDVLAWRMRMAKDYMNINLLERRDSILREEAFNEDEARKYMSKFNVKPHEITTLSTIAERYRDVLLRSE